MGTDIHIRVEVQRDDGLWYVATPPVKTWGYRDDGGPWLRSWYHDRNYDVFAVLADVRNGSGFAGVTTGSALCYISEPRGLPEDAVPAKMAETDRDWSVVYERRLPPEEDRHLKDEHAEDVEYVREDGWEHSLTWFTLRELLDAQEWKQGQTKVGFVDAPTYRRWFTSGAKAEGQGPDNWSGDVSGGGIRKVNERMMQAFIIGAEFAGKSLADYADDLFGRSGRLYCQVTWHSGMPERAARFLAELREDVLPLAPGGDQDRVRLLIGFDS